MQPSEIEERLHWLVGQITQAARQAETLKFTWESAKVQQKQLEADSRIQHRLAVVKSLGKKPTDKDLEAFLDTVCVTERLALIGMESAYRQAMIDVGGFENEYNALKKIVALRVSEMQHASFSEK